MVVMILRGSVAAMRARGAVRLKAMTAAILGRTTIVPAIQNGNAYISAP